MKQIRMHGVGGQGVVTGGEILSNAFLLEGKYMAVMPSYGVERRGSDVTAFGRLSDEPVRENGLTYEPDYLFLLDPSQISKQKSYEGFPEGGVIIACGTDVNAVMAMGVKPSKVIMVDGIRIAFEVNGNNLTNMVMCGAFCKAEELKLEDAIKAMENNLPKNFVKTSVLSCQRGYDESTVYELTTRPAEKSASLGGIARCLSAKLPISPSMNHSGVIMRMPTSSSLFPPAHGRLPVRYLTTKNASNAASAPLSALFSA